MAVQVYVNFNGDCREAVTFYAKVFGSDEPKIMQYGDMQANDSFPMDDATKKLVLHTNLMIHGSLVLFSDAMPGQPVTTGDNITLTISTKDEDTIRANFAQLKEGGKVVMELQETFFSKCYGSLVDRFGIGWQFTCENQ